MIRPLLLFLLMAATLPAAAAGTQALDTIRAAARDYIIENLDGLAGRVVVEATALDSRLRLNRCARPLEAFLPNGSIGPGNVTVGVRCTGSRPWSLYVPVAVKVMQPVAVLARAKSRGEILERADFIMEERDTVSLRAGHFDDPEALVGMRMRLSLAAGGVVSHRHLERPSLVKRGERVLLISGARGFSVQMHGRALGDAAAGERVRVENTSSSRVVEGRVTPDGKVRIQL